jgi:lipoate-protein ligase B
MMPLDPAGSCRVQRLGLVNYQEAWDLQRSLVDACRERGEQHLLLLEHPPTYTFGVRGKQEHLLLNEQSLAHLGAAVHRVDRGGDVTFHGPGQLVGYPIIDLRRWGQGPLWYVRSLEAVLIEALSRFGIGAQRQPGRPGVWLGGAKIASIGVHVSRGITSHGFALNVDPDLRYFSHIVPCGLPDVTVTSLAEALTERRGGQPPALSDRTVAPTPSMAAVMDAVVAAFARSFGLQMLDPDRRGGQRPALGDRMVAPTARLR